MRTTIDAGGRVVIPKDIRDLLGLTPGQTVDVAALDGRISIDVTGVGMHLENRDGVPVAVIDDEVPALTTTQVRAAVEQLRR
ncbi:MAG: AbrB/MazE/SpoVT family DNA-binding domain-containing protein [Nocardioidaceae bacterium]|jgi:AbrB family looped-hinge helix DNA binding protein|nr:AbrB/MazE/SpoVT family DNA-binding domain-containing protein [Nocardioidaceae bacterium]